MVHVLNMNTHERSWTTMTYDYMTFEQASELLNVSRSTLYRWLREGKVPGHKLGRQWRFVREELEQWTRQGPDGQATRALARLGDRLRERHQGRLKTQTPDDSTEQERQMPSAEKMQQWFDGIEITERLIWDAADEDARVIHIEPRGEQHQIRYRTAQGLERLATIQREAFELLDTQWRGSSQAMRNDHTRRMYLERARAATSEGAEEPEAQEGATERLQVLYQKVPTMAGERVALRIVRADRIKTSLDAITRGDQDRETLRRWARSPYGIVLLSGRSGSGKTSTAYACVSELAQDQDRIIFTLEDSVGFFLEGINQVEVDLDDAQAYRETFSAIFGSDLDVLFIASTFAQRHRPLLWGTALNAAESGHLVLVQLEAESAEDAIECFQQSVERSIDDHLVGASWQELVPNPEGPGQMARYELLGGPLDIES